MNIIDTNFAQVVRDLRKGRMVACTEAYPVLPASEGSHATKQYFLDHPHDFITNDGRSIYYSADNVLKLNEAGITTTSSDVHDYLIREYAHLFLQHSRLRKYYDKDDLRMNTFLVACEIEACRTRGISKERTCYKTSATDDLFPCTKNAESLRDIYQALVDEYGDQIEDYANGDNQDGEQSGEREPRDGDNSGDGSGDDQQRGEGGSPSDDSNASSDNGNGNSDRNSDGDSSSKTFRDSGDSQKQSDGQQGGDSTPNGGDDSRKRTEMGDGRQDGQASDGDQGNQSKHRGNDGLPQPNRGAGTLSDNQKRVIKKTFTRADKKLSPADGDDQMLQDYGYSPDEASERSGINALIDCTYKRWKDNQIKKQLKKLKSAIEGVVSKRQHSTYARPSRRACVANGLLTKGRKKDLVGQPTILVALDASGSMDTQSVKDLTRCIGNIFDDLGRPKKGCYICMFDTQIFDQKPMREWRDVVEKYEADGGTYYPAVLKLARKLDVDVVIEVGDGAGRLSDDSTQHPSLLRDFKEKGRKWYDVLVIHSVDELRWTLQNHVEYDKRVADIDREVICLDKDIAIKLDEWQREKS